MIADQGHLYLPAETRIQMKTNVDDEAGMAASVGSSRLVGGLCRLPLSALVGRGTAWLAEDSTAAGCASGRDG